MANKKIFKADTKVKVINNTNSQLQWKSNITGKLIIWQRAGVPCMVSFEDLQDIAWNDDRWIPEGLIYIPDKEAFDALELTHIQWEDITPTQDVIAMLSQIELNTLDLNKLISELKKLKSASKDALAQYVFDNHDKFTGAIINTVEEATGIKIKQMIDDYNANQENINNK
jgi:hypothetical protein